MKSLSTAITRVILLVAILALVGCGGGGGVGSGSQGPAQPAGDVTIQGRVIAADNPAWAFAQARVTVLPSGQSATTNTSGQFALLQVPSGTLTLEVNPANSPNYQAAAVIIPTVPGDQVNLSVALLPATAEEPTIIALAPLGIAVEVGSQVQFQAAIVTESGTTAFVPTWLAVGPAGAITPAGLFSATTPGTSDIYAFSGAASNSTTISVLPVQAPEITEVIVNPQTLTASGGTITITSACTDGQGVDTVLATIYYPGGAVDQVGLGRVAGTARDGSYRATYEVPANSNIPDPDGVQAPQTYYLQIAATDIDSRLRLSELVTFEVAGLEPPPPPPPPPS